MTSTSARRIGLWTIQSLIRNKLLSITTIIGIALIIFFVNVLSSVQFLSDISIHEISQKIDLTLELNEGTKIDDPSVLNLKKEIEALGISVSQVSKEEALDEFKKISASDLVQFLETYQINPLPASLLVKADTLEQYKSVENIVEKDDYKNLVNINQNENSFVKQKDRIEKIQQITSGITRGVLSMQLLFFLIAIIIIVNTLQIVISHRSEEIDIMQLVGAPRSIIITPFMLEGVIYAFLGVAVGITVFIICISIIEANILAYLPETSLHPFFQTLTDHYRSDLFRIAFRYMSTFCLVGVISSLIATSRYVTLVRFRSLPLISLLYKHST